LVQEAKKQVVLLGSESLYCIRTHSYCVDQRWGSEVARATACAGLLILKVAGVLGRAGGLPSGPILSRLRRTLTVSPVYTLLNTSNVTDAMLTINPDYK
jgi:hypothetical protein